MWDMNTGQETLSIKAPCDRALSVTFTPDGRHLAWAGSDNTVRILRAEEPKELDPDLARKQELGWHAREAQNSEAAGNWLSASWHLERLLRSEPNECSNWMRRSHVDAELSQIDHALTDYAKAIQLGADHTQLSRYLERLDKLQSKDGTPQRVEMRVREVIRFRKLVAAEYPDAPECQEDLAISQLQLTGILLNAGRTREAEATYQSGITALDKALAKSPRVADHHPRPAAAVARLAFDLLVAADSRLRDPVKALELSRKAVLLDPQNFRAWRALGWSYYRNGAYKESIEALEKSCKVEDNGLGASWQWFGLAMAHWQLGDKEEARKWYGDAVKQVSDDAAWSRLRAEAEELIVGKGNK
jgi:tetratricopeptide (TPR) repeat protein